MQSQDSQKNIRSIRTFKDDIAFARTQLTPDADLEKNTIPVSAPILVKPIGDIEDEIKIPARDSIVAPVPVPASVPLATPVKETPRIPKRPKEDTVPKRSASIKIPVAPLFIPKNEVDLSNEVAAISTPQKESILSDTDDSFLDPETRSGNIIRDTKRKRFRLIPAMIEATKEWFIKNKDAYVASRRKEYNVASAESREDIIKAAVREDALAPKEDFKDVASRMKSVERKEVSSTLTFKEKSEVPPPSWTYVTQTTEPETTTAVPKEVPADVITPEEPEVLPALIPTEELSVESTLETAAPLEATLPTAASVREEQDVVEPIEEAPSKREVPEEAPTAVVEAEEIAAPTQEPEVLEDTELIVASEERKMPIVLFIFVIIGATLLGIGLSYYWFILKDAPSAPEIIVEEFKIPELLIQVPQKSFLLTGSRSSTLDAIRALVATEQRVVQLYPAIVEDNIEKPASLQLILNELAFRAPGSFTRSIKELTFGADGASQPFVIMKVTNFDTAFAGMLQWENTMSADLSLLFGEPVIQTFDPQARTSTQVRDAFFKDVIASNKNVRLLLDEEGRDRIVYTFTDQNTILITTTREALQTILPLVK